jgi:hypothetical protein
MKRSEVLFVLTVALLLASPLRPARADEGQPSPKPTKAFRATDYPEPRFHVTQADYEAEGLEIRMVQAQDRAPHGFTCRGWLRLRPAGGAPRWIYRGDIEAVGSSYGLFVPSTQPMRRFFLAVELNGYDGKLLIIDGKGTIREVPGGAFLHDHERRLLFSESFSDAGPALVVLDLDSGKTLFQAEKPGSYHWYRLGSDLFFTTSTRAKGHGPAEDRATGYSYDAAKRTVVPRVLTPEIWSRAEPVERDFDPRWYQDCTSEERRYFPKN